MAADAGGTSGLGPWRSGEVEGFDPFPDDAVARSVGERFAEVAERHAGERALSSPSLDLTYEELAGRARTLAAGVLARSPREGGQGDGSESPSVALLLDHDGPLVVAILGVILAGHVVVVLDPAAPASQTEAVLAESQAVLLLHDEAHAEAAAALGDATSTPVATAADCAGDPSVELPEPAPGDPLMLAFTSGTSTLPKGAVITHGVLLNLIRGATNALGITPADRMPMLFPVSLAVASYPMFLPLLNGGTLATLDVRSVGLEPVGPFLERERITLVYMAPTVVRFLVDSLGGRTFPDLRMVALGGEPVDPDAVELTTRLFSPELLANGFGTTETGVIALHVLDPSDPVADVVPAGHPVPDVELLVLDDEGAEVAAGHAGEIAVVSPHVFAGYRGHPELSRQVLADDPRGRQGWRLYRTGDLGRIDDSGELVVLGRVDSKVKVRGRFVVIGDVEQRLHGLEAVGDAVVVADREEGVVSLGAVVARAPGVDRLDTAGLRAALLEDLEAFAVPSRWVVVDELPRLPNGKLDRRAAHELVVSRGGAGSPVDVSPSRDPRTSGPASSGTAGPSPDVERAVRDIWEELLPGAVVGPDDDFFHLGGDSLLAAQMLVVVDQRLGVTVPMGRLVDARTLREVAAVVAEVAGEGEPSTVAEVKRARGEARPRLWFVHDLQGSAYRVRHLAEALPPQQPVWSFESPFLRGEPDRFHSLDAFAARYVTDLLEAQPEGPYWLAGYSFGGICAYEMARQLRRDGHEVAFVGIVDVGPAYRGPGGHAGRSPFRPWFGVAKPPPEGSSPTEVVAHYRGMARSSPAAFARHLMVRSGVSRLVDPLRFRVDLARRGRVRPEWRLWYAWEQHWRLAAREWDRSSTYDGTVDLFWAEDTASGDATMGWGPLVGELRVHRFPGDHEGLLEPRGATALAVALEEVLARMPG